MLDIIKNLKNAEKKAETIIDDSNIKSEELIKETKESLNRDLKGLETKYNELEKDGLDKIKKELDAEIKKIEGKGINDIESIKSKEKSNKIKINEEITKTLFS
jgi:vacuolar-type H+-ATPase subunit H|tara:strand:- start:117 stop:425 length:309 start_codon:yes stop_codon:yes gene_type:complete